MSLYHLYRSVIVAVVSMHMMESAVYQIIEMIAVWYSLVSTAGSVFMSGPTTGVQWLALVGVGRIYVQYMLVVVTLVGVV